MSAPDSSSPETDRSPDPRAAPSPVEHGARVELRLHTSGEEASPDGAQYDARWFVGQADPVEGTVTVTLKPRAEVTLRAGAALPEWVEVFTRRILTTASRGAETSWPRRITRWRAAP